MTWLNDRQRNDLDNYITGHYGEDQNRDDDTIDSLCKEYAAWNKSEGLNLGSADEHLDDETLTERQRQWLADFSERWQTAALADREIDEDKFRQRLDGAIDEIMSLPTLRHADDCECDDCHERDPLNGPRSIFSVLVWLAVLCCGLAVLIVWYRLFA